MSRERTIRCTVTGADDAVDPKELVRLAEEFPFVEWGILFSATRAGGHRYPSRSWVSRLHRANQNSAMNLSAHFCGAMARETLAGESKHVMDLPTRGFSPMFQRVQLNGYSTETKSAEDLRFLAGGAGIEFILQVRSLHEMHGAFDDARVMNTNDQRQRLASILFDPSGGTGTSLLTADSIPKPPTAEPFTSTHAPSPTPLRMGYAGGINPENVDEVIAALPSTWSWIDLETGARDEQDNFDVDRVREVLARVQIQLVKQHVAGYSLKKVGEVFASREDVTPSGEQCGCGGAHVLGRACTDAEKRRVLDALYEQWTKPVMRTQRLGQMLYCSMPMHKEDLFNIEDDALVASVNKFSKREFEGVPVMKKSTKVEP